MTLRFEAVLPGKFDPSVFEREMQAALEEAAEGMLNDFESTVDTWNEKPTFEIDGNNNARLMDIHVFCDALRDGDRIPGTDYPNPAPVNLRYYFLNYGTSVRYATMSPDFEPKTQVRVLGSFPGAGSLAGVSTWRPRAGIKARHWDDEIRQKYDRIFPNLARDAMARAVRASGHHYEGVPND